MEIVTSKGILKYKMPNILEAYDLIRVSGIANGTTDPFILKRNIIENMNGLLDLSNLEGVSTYEDVLNDVETFVEPLGKIADEIVLKTFVAFKKKTS